MRRALQPPTDLFAALNAQSTRPVRFHITGIPSASLAANNDPIYTSPKPGPQIKGLKQRCDRQPVDSGGDA
jgi:hypothetical protein